jgi:hypothetical protein
VRKEPKDMATSELVCELAAQMVRSMRLDGLTHDDWERHRAVEAELDRRIPK